MNEEDYGEQEYQGVGGQIEDPNQIVSGIEVRLPAPVDEESILQDNVLRKRRRIDDDEDPALDDTMTREQVLKNEIGGGKRVETLQTDIVDPTVASLGLPQQVPAKKKIQAILVKSYSQAPVSQFVGDFTPTLTGQFEAGQYKPEDQAYAKKLFEDAEEQRFAAMSDLIKTIREKPEVVDTYGNFNSTAPIFDKKVYSEALSSYLESVIKFTQDRHTLTYNSKGQQLKDDIQQQLGMMSEVLSMQKDLFAGGNSYIDGLKSRVNREDLSILERTFARKQLYVMDLSRIMLQKTTEDLLLSLQTGDSVLVRELQQQRMAQRKYNEQFSAAIQKEVKKKKRIHQEDEEEEKQEEAYGEDLEQYDDQFELEEYEHKKKRGKKVNVIEQYQEQEIEEFLDQKLFRRNEKELTVMDRNGNLKQFPRPESLRDKHIKKRNFKASDKKERLFVKGLELLEQQKFVSSRLDKDRLKDQDMTLAYVYDSNGEEVDLDMVVKPKVQYPVMTIRVNADTPLIGLTDGRDTRVYLDKDLLLASMITPMHMAFDSIFKEATLGGKNFDEDQTFLQKTRKLRQDFNLDGEAQKNYSRFFRGDIFQYGSPFAFLFNKYRAFLINSDITYYGNIEDDQDNAKLSAEILNKALLRQNFLVSRRPVESFSLEQLQQDFRQYGPQAEPLKALYNKGLLKNDSSIYFAKYFKQITRPLFQKVLIQEGARFYLPKVDRQNNRNSWWFYELNKTLLPLCQGVYQNAMAFDRYMIDDDQLYQEEGDSLVKIVRPDGMNQGFNRHALKSFINKKSEQLEVNLPAPGDNFLRRQSTFLEKFHQFAKASHHPSPVKVIVEKALEDMVEGNLSRYFQPNQIMRINKRAKEATLIQQKALYADYDMGQHYKKVNGRNFFVVSPKQSITLDNLRDSILIELSKEIGDIFKRGKKEIDRAYQIRVLSLLGSLDQQSNPNLQDEQYHVIAHPLASIDGKRVFSEYVSSIRRELSYIKNDPTNPVNIAMTKLSGKFPQGKIAWTVLKDPEAFAIDPQMTMVKGDQEYQKLGFEKMRQKLGDLISLGLLKQNKISEELWKKTLELQEDIRFFENLRPSQKAAARDPKSGARFNSLIEEYMRPIIKYEKNEMGQHAQRFIDRLELITGSDSRWELQKLQAMEEKGHNYNPLFLGYRNNFKVRDSLHMIGKFMDLAELTVGKTSPFQSILKVYDQESEDWYLQNVNTNSRQLVNAPSLMRDPFDNIKRYQALQRESYGQAFKRALHWGDTITRDIQRNPLHYVNTSKLIGSASIFRNYGNDLSVMDLATPWARNYKSKLEKSELVITLENSSIIRGRNELGREQIENTQYGGDVKLQQAIREMLGKNQGLHEFFRYKREKGQQLEPQILDQRAYVGFRRALQDMDESSFEVSALEKNSGTNSSLIIDKINDLGNLIELENDIIRGKKKPSDRVNQVVDVSMVGLEEKKDQLALQMIRQPNQVLQVQESEVAPADLSMINQQEEQEQQNTEQVHEQTFAAMEDMKQEEFDIQVLDEGDKEDDLNETHAFEQTFNKEQQQQQQQQQQEIVEDQEGEDAKDNEDDDQVQIDTKVTDTKEEEKNLCMSCRAPFETRDGNSVDRFCLRNQDCGCTEYRHHLTCVSYAQTLSYHNYTQQFYIDSAAQLDQVNKNVFEYANATEKLAIPETTCAFCERKVMGWPETLDCVTNYSIHKYKPCTSLNLTRKLLDDRESRNQVVTFDDLMGVHQEEGNIWQEYWNLIAREKQQMQNKQRIDQTIENMSQIGAPEDVRTVVLDESFISIAKNLGAYEEIKKDVQDHGQFAYNSSAIAELALESPELENHQERLQEQLQGRGYLDRIDLERYNLDDQLMDKEFTIQQEMQKFKNMMHENMQLYGHYDEYMQSLINDIGLKSSKMDRLRNYVNKEFLSLRQIKDLDDMVDKKQELIGSVKTMTQDLKEYKMEAHNFNRVVKELEKYQKLGEDALLKKRDFDKLNSDIEKRQEQFKLLEEKLASEKTNMVDAYKAYAQQITELNQNVKDFQQLEQQLDQNTIMRKLKESIAMQKKMRADLTLLERQTQGQDVRTNTLLERVQKDTEKTVELAEKLRGEQQNLQEQQRKQQELKRQMKEHEKAQKEIQKLAGEIKRTNEESSKLFSRQGQQSGVIIGQLRNSVHDQHKKLLQLESFYLDHQLPVPQDVQTIKQELEDALKSQDTQKLLQLDMQRITSFFNKQNLQLDKLDTELKQKIKELKVVNQEMQQIRANHTQQLTQYRMLVGDIQSSWQQLGRPEIFSTDPNQVNSILGTLGPALGEQRRYVDTLKHATESAQKIFQKLQKAQQEHSQEKNSQLLKIQQIAGTLSSVELNQDLMSTLQSIVDDLNTAVSNDVLTPQVNANLENRLNGVVAKITGLKAQDVTVMTNLNNVVQQLKRLGVDISKAYNDRAVLQTELQLLQNNLNQHGVNININTAQHSVDGYQKTVEELQVFQNKQHSEHLAMKALVQEGLSILKEVIAVKKKGKVSQQEQRKVLDQIQELSVKYYVDLNQGVPQGVAIKSEKDAKDLLEKMKFGQSTMEREIKTLEERKQEIMLKTIETSKKANELRKLQKVRKNEEEKLKERALEISILERADDNARNIIRVGREYISSLSRQDGAQLLAITQQEFTNFQNEISSMTNMENKLARGSDARVAQAVNDILTINEVQTMRELFNQTAQSIAIFKNVNSQIIREVYTQFASTLQNMLIQGVRSFSGLFAIHGQGSENLGFNKLENKEMITEDLLKNLTYCASLMKSANRQSKEVHLVDQAWLRWNINQNLTHQNDAVALQEARNRLDISKGLAVIHNNLRKLEVSFNQTGRTSELSLQAMANVLNEFKKIEKKIFKVQDQNFAYRLEQQLKEVVNTNFVNNNLLQRFHAPALNQASEPRRHFMQALSLMFTEGVRQFIWTGQYANALDINAFLDKLKPSVQGESQVVIRQQNVQEVEEEVKTFFNHSFDELKESVVTAIARLYGSKISDFAETLDKEQMELLLGNKKNALEFMDRQGYINSEFKQQLEQSKVHYAKVFENAQGRMRMIARQLQEYIYSGVFPQEEDANQFTPQQLQQQIKENQISSFGAQVQLGDDLGAKVYNSERFAGIQHRIYTSTTKQQLKEIRNEVAKSEGELITKRNFHAWASLQQIDRLPELKKAQASILAHFISHVVPSKFAIWMQINVGTVENQGYRSITDVSQNRRLMMALLTRGADLINQIVQSSDLFIEKGVTVPDSQLVRMIALRNLLEKSREVAINLSPSEAIYQSIGSGAIAHELYAGILDSAAINELELQAPGTSHCQSLRGDILQTLTRYKDFVSNKIELARRYNIESLNNELQQLDIIKKEVDNRENRESEYDKYVKQNEKIQQFQEKIQSSIQQKLFSVGLKEFLQQNPQNQEELRRQVNNSIPRYYPQRAPAPQQSQQQQQQQQQGFGNRYSSQMNWQSKYQQNGGGQVQQEQAAQPASQGGPQSYFMAYPNSQAATSGDPKQNRLNDETLEEAYNIKRVKKRDIEFLRKISFDGTKLLIEDEKTKVKRALTDEEKKRFIKLMAIIVVYLYSKVISKLESGEIAQKEKQVIEEFEKETNPVDLIKAANEFIQQRKKKGDQSSSSN